MKTLPLASMVDLLGDGHRGIWSLFAQMELPGFSDEILDWYHLKKNLYKVDAAEDVIEHLSSQLLGRPGAAGFTQLAALNNDSAKRFSAYLSARAGRIPNYRCHQMEGWPIGAGPVESWIKQIDARLQITGTQWNEETLPQMLKLRCAYLNNRLHLVSSVRE